MGKTTVPPAMIPDHKEIFVDPLRRITRLQTKPGTDLTETFSQPRKKYTRYKKYTTTEKSHGRIGVVVDKVKNNPKAEQSVSLFFEYKKLHR